MRLLLCSGSMIREGWKTLDAAGDVDFLCSIPPLPPLEESLDEAELIHGIASFQPWEAKQLLEDVYSALNPGGKLTLEQPDLRVVCGIGRPQWIWGDPVPQNPMHMNKWGYTPCSLSALLQDVGFTRIRVLPAQYHIPERDFRIEAIK